MDIEEKKKKEYKYFIVYYYYKNRNNQGYGNTQILTGRKIKDFCDIEEIQNKISEKEKHMTTLLLNYILMQGQ